MSGQTNLSELLKALSPALLPDDYVFVFVKGLTFDDLQPLSPISVFIEEQGMSLILKQKIADLYGYSYTGVFKCITLTVHSSLEAVGLTAAVSSALAEQNISVNLVAAFHHDHIFVNKHSAEQAMLTLQALSKEERNKT